MIREGVRRGVGRRELQNRVREMKDCVDKSMGIVTLIVIVEVLVKINHTESLRFVRCAARRKRN